jgi:hypothetical protein
LALHSSEFLELLVFDRKTWPLAICNSNFKILVRKDNSAYSAAHLVKNTAAIKLQLASEEYKVKKKKIKTKHYSEKKRLLNIYIYI